MDNTPDDLDLRSAATVGIARAWVGALRRRPRTPHQTATEFTNYQRARV